MKDKIPFYNIANMFFVGAVFAIANVLLFHECLLDMDLSSQLYMTLKDWSIVATAAIIVVVFEIGFILNRASSVLIAPILEKTKIWPKEKYNLDVSELSNKHPKFQFMITDLVLIRTHILMYLILAIESLFSPYKLASLVCLSIILVIVFLEESITQGLILCANYLQKKKQKKRSTIKSFTISLHMTERPRNRVRIAIKK